MYKTPTHALSAVKGLVIFFPEAMSVYCTATNAATQPGNIQLSGSRRRVHLVPITAVDVMLCVSNVVRSPGLLQSLKQRDYAVHRGVCGHPGFGFHCQWNEWACKLYLVAVMVIYWGNRFGYYPGHNWLPSPVWSCCSGCIVTIRLSAKQVLSLIPIRIFRIEEDITVARKR